MKEYVALLLMSRDNYVLVAEGICDKGIKNNGCEKILK